MSEAEGGANEAWPRSGLSRKGKKEASRLHAGVQAEDDIRQEVT